MRFVRRLFPWLCKFALLSCVGVPVYLYVRHTPRCTVDGIVRLGGLSMDGRTLLVNDFSAQWFKDSAGAERREDREAEQIRLYDTHSGRVVQCFDQVTGHAACPDSRHFALQIGRDTVVVDLVTRTHWTLPRSDHPVFSPTGKWLWVRQNETSVLVCAQSGRVARRSPADSLMFFCDDRYVSESGEDHDFELIEVATDAKKRLPMSQLDLPGYDIAASPEGRWLAVGSRYLVGRTGVMPLWEPSTWKEFESCEIWDWHNRKQIAKFRHGSKPWGDPWTVKFAADNRHVAVWRAGEEVRDLKIFDLEGGANVEVAFPSGLFAVKPDEGTQSYSCSSEFSPDGAHFVIDHSFNDGQRIAMIETEAGRLLWSKANWEFVCFGPGGACLLEERGDKQNHRDLRLVDIKSGKVLVRFDANLRADYFHMDSSFDGSRRLMVFSSLGEQWRPPTPTEEWFQKHLPWLGIAQCPGLAVVDLATGQRRFGLNSSARDFILSADGSTLATCRSCRGKDGDLTDRVEVWDLRPHRALFWSVTISVAAGILAILLRRISKQKRPAHS